MVFSMVGERFEFWFWRWGVCVGLGLVFGFWVGGVLVCVVKEGLSRLLFCSCVGRFVFVVSICIVRFVRRCSVLCMSGRRSCGVCLKVGWFCYFLGCWGVLWREVWGVGCVVGFVFFFGGL